MTGNFPDWLKSLTQHWYDYEHVGVACHHSHPQISSRFLFPFECRQLLFYLTTFDRDRAICRLQVCVSLMGREYTSLWFIDTLPQEQQPDLSSPGDGSERAIPKLDKKKVSKSLTIFEL